MQLKTLMIILAGIAATSAAPPLDETFDSMLSSEDDSATIEKRGGGAFGNVDVTFYVKAKFQGESDTYNVPVIDWAKEGKKHGCNTIYPSLRTRVRSIRIGRKDTNCRFFSDDKCDNYQFVTALGQDTPNLVSQANDRVVSYFCYRKLAM